ncbi:hypothetical protein ACFR9U_06795 [Halorientalis brevis]|uniref:Uncharacterized protein n=1 Tax=Halorientalis brevis TaxID=1126241 RepID=A0ABD6C9F1_9EURY|nr:hypothetical protein [Halorientalis brevis]
MPEWFRPKFGLLLGGFPVVLLWIVGFRDGQLLVLLALTWALGGWLTARQWEVWNGQGPEKLWGILAGILPFAVGKYGVHGGLPLSNEQEYALQLLVFGVGLTAVGLGVEMGTSAEKS